MTNPATKNSLSKIYSTTALIAFFYSGFLIVFSIYKQFFYVDQTWFHGFMANGFGIFSYLVWMGILIVFKLFLNKVLHYNKANSVIIACLISIAVAVLSVSSVMLASLQIYFSNGIDQINTLTSFASTSISDAIRLILATIGIIVTTILLGDRMRKIDFILKDLFRILGFALIVDGICLTLNSVHLIDADIITFLVKAFTVAVLGCILKKAAQMDYNELSAIRKFETSTDLNPSKVNAPVKVSSQKEPERAEKISVLKKKEIVQEHEAIPDFDSNELEDKELVLAYLENLSPEELNRLEMLVAKKYNQNLTGEQTKNLIIHHIADKKLYDHNRYAPK